jgi:hypothetical protein
MSGQPPAILGASAGRWNAWVAGGADWDARRARLETCPAHLRAGVAGHLRTLRAIAARRADPAWQAWAAQVLAREAAARTAAGLHKPIDPDAEAAHG